MLDIRVNAALDARMQQGQRSPGGRRSSCTSVDLLEQEDVGARYPVDDIHVPTKCSLLVTCMGTKVEAGRGVAYPPIEGEQVHCV